MQTLKLGLVQADIIWENKLANLEKLEKLILSSPDRDIYILPEMFNTGYSMNANRLAESPDGSTLAWMKQLSEKTSAAITGSFIVSDNGAYYNRLAWVEPDGNVLWYNKRHLFSMASEDKFFTPGEEKLIFDYKGFKICIVICYDIRFPVWLRNTEKYDLLIVVASWPEKRIHHWEKLLYARAIENQCYVAAVNRVGADGNGIQHTGMSMVIDPQGELIIKSNNVEEIIFGEIDKERIKFTRRFMPFLADRDQFEIKI